MTPGPSSTNATRVLEALKVPFALAEFPAADFTAEEAVEKLGVPAETVFKTLVAKGDRSGALSAVIPTPARLSLKKLARVSGNKTVALVPVEEMERLTGYVKGGCSPLGMKKRLPVFVHETARNLDSLYVSAGRRGVQLVVKGEDLIRAAGATAADLIEE
ncbi:MAG: Cys-tRNA(Pro) deacylase [Acidobacteria bacterium]|nr:Cys-tRNA(Pro) deacylase [Acidobacteriota bacterium]MCG3191196.1 Cys-tRNA(Pro)/Cys-tRNA(Cys) deacylase YbaK [Thermoanaerobaculia bacterium]MCK6685543.1 Cys-tRNA(Pro) deacylase [Thermoanaerobaculia bacterium]